MYSPPPLDGFSPPPMSDVSPLREYPPPINGFSDDGDDEEVLDYDIPIIDDAEYDLTGLSDKLKSLEIDKISNLPPREILELQKESSEVKNLCVNGVPSFQENGFTCEPPGLNSEEDKVEPSEDLTENFEPHDSHKQAPVLVNGSNSNEISDVRLSEGAPETETSPVSPDNGDSVNGEGMKAEEKWREFTPEADAGEAARAEIPVVNIPALPNNGDSDLNNEEGIDAKESWGDFTSEAVNGIIENNEDKTSPEEHTSPTNLENNEDKTSSDDFTSPNPNAVDVVEDDFGDWTTGNEVCVEDEGWGNFDSEPAQDCDFPVTSDPVSHGPPLQFDESDDEFGDFGEADTNSVKLEESTMQVSDSSTIVKTLETLSAASAQLLLSVFVPLGSLDEEPNQLSLDNVVMEEHGIFETISNPASCPALDHQWRDSAAHKVIMETLGIDSRVLVSLVTT